MMNEFKQRQFFWPLVVLLACASCNAEDVPAQDDSYQKPVDWRSECVGRLQMDLPEPINFGTTGDLKDGHQSVLNYRLNAPGLKHIGRGMFSLAGTKLGEHPSAKVLTGQGIDVFDIGFFSKTDGKTRLFTLPDRNKENSWLPLLTQLNSENLRTQQLNHINAVVKNLLPRYQVRKPGEIPTTPGICTPYGFFADPPEKTERDYVFNMRFQDPRHSNLILGIEIKTRNPLNMEGWETVPSTIREAKTPWDLEREQARSSKENCRAQQGTASRDLFGCTFAGMTTIRKHREVVYLKIGNGQEARLLVMEYNPRLNEGVAYDVMIETAGVEDSPTQPRIVISARGIDGDTEVDALRGKSPPPLDEAVEIARKLALSLRLRPGAVDTTRPVADSLAGVR